MKKIIFTLAQLSIFTFVSAQDDMVTDRPDVTESALTIPLKSVQLETGITYNSEHPIDSYTLPEYLIRVGIHQFLELRLENTVYQINDDAKFRTSDLFLGVKAQILRKEKLNVAFLSHINLPENNRGKVLFVEKLLVSYEINDNSEIAFNLGVDDLNQENSGQFVYSVAYGRSLTDKFGFYLENYGSIHEGKLTSFIDGGFSYLLKSKVQLDTKFGIDTQYFKDYFVGVGISIRFFN